MAAAGGRRWARRRFLAGAGAVAVAAAGGAVWAAGRSAGGPGDAAAGSTAAAPPARTALPSATSPPRGGTARVAAAARLNFDTFDPLRAAERSVEEVLGRTHSRVVHWANYEAGEIAGDLAHGWEQVDEQTLAVSIREDARWQDRAPVGGRALTGADVVAHFERLLSMRAAGELPAPLARDFALIESVAGAGDGTVVFRMAAVDPLLLAALASRFALVVAPESVEAFGGTWHRLDPLSVVGSGPFLFESGEAATLRFTRHPGTHRPPHLDGLALNPPAGSGEGATARFLSRELDAFLARDRRDVARLREDAAGAHEHARLEDSMTISTVFAGAPPWSDARLLRALSMALNRYELSRRLHGGQAMASGPVTPAGGRFALTGEELARLPGYRADPAQDAREARALWQEAGGPALGQVTIDFPAIYDPLYSASSIVTGYLNEVLGSQFVGEVRQYTAISARAVAREYGNGQPALWFGWGPPVDDPDPSRMLLDTYRTGATGWQSFGAAVAGLDPVLDALSREFDLEVRAGLAREASGLILAAGGAGVFTWLQQTGAMFEWPYLHRPEATPFWSGHLDAGAFLDADLARPE